MPVAGNFDTGGIPHTEYVEGGPEQQIDTENLSVEQKVQLVHSEMTKFGDVNRDFAEHVERLGEMVGGEQWSEDEDADQALEEAAMDVEGYLKDQAEQLGVDMDDPEIQALRDEVMQNMKQSESEEKSSFFESVRNSKLKKPLQVAAYVMRAIASNY